MTNDSTKCCDAPQDRHCSESTRDDHCGYTHHPYRDSTTNTTEAEAGTPPGNLTKALQEEAEARVQVDWVWMHVDDETYSWDVRDSGYFQPALDVYRDAIEARVRLEVKAEVAQKLWEIFKNPGLVATVTEEPRTWVLDPLIAAASADAGARLVKLTDAVHDYLYGDMSLVALEEAYDIARAALAS